MEAKHTALVNEVVKKIGVNILLFQQIERGLKLILPFLCPPNSTEKRIDIVRQQKEELELATLGKLVNNLIKSVDYDPDYFSEQLKKIVEGRNKLVHSFGSSEGLHILDTVEGCKGCLAHLETQRKEAYFFYETIQLLVLSLAWLFQRHYGKSNPKFNLLYRNLKAEIIDTVEYVNLIDPFETTWKNTSLVRLLRLAEIHTEKINGMTLLSKAGKFIKEQDPECKPKQYGIKTLKGILEVSGLFEIIESQDGSILYRSKAHDI